MGIIGLLCLLLIGSFAFPVMSINVPGLPESAVITVTRGNLFEHSIFGIFPIAAAMLAFANACTGNWSAKRRMLAILMLALSTVAYFIAFFEAKEWLLSISSCEINYGIGTAVYLISETLLSTALIFKRARRKNSVESATTSTD